MTKVRFPMTEDSGFQCLGIDTAEITAFELDADDNLNVWFRGCPEAVSLRKVDLDPNVFSSVLDVVITEFPHIDESKFKAS